MDNGELYHWGATTKMCTLSAEEIFHREKQTDRLKTDSLPPCIHEEQIRHKFTEKSPCKRAISNKFKRAEIAEIDNEPSNRTNRIGGENRPLEKLKQIKQSMLNRQKQTVIWKKKQWRREVEACFFSLSILPVSFPKSLT